jgi:hypothetical protein
LVVVQQVQMGSLRRVLLLLRLVLPLVVAVVEVRFTPTVLAVLPELGTTHLLLVVSVHILGHLEVAAAVVSLERVLQVK